MDKQTRSFVLTVLLIFGFFSSAYSVAFVEPVQGAALAVNLNPASARPGDVVFVTATGVTQTSGTCAVTSTMIGLVPSSTTLTVVSPGPGGTASGSFVVGTVPSNSTGGGYSIIVNCPTTTPTDTGSAQLFVLPKVTLSPSTGLANQIITMTGVGFRANASLCAISGTPVGTSTCSFSGTGTVSGQFAVSAAAADGGYNVTVSPNLGIPGNATFWKVSVSRIVKLSPAIGTGGDTVQVTGSGFNSADTTCEIQADAPYVFDGTPTCSTSGGSVTGSFKIRALANPAANHTIIVNATMGDLGAANLTVIPKITLNPTSATVGKAIAISGSNFAASDSGTTCTITSSPDGAISPTDDVCNIDASSMVVASFTFVPVGEFASSFTIIVTGSVDGSSASAVLTIVYPTLSLDPTSGPSGIAVTASGPNYPTPPSTTCSLVSTGPGTLFTSHACVVSSGTLAGGFTVDPGAPVGSYTVTARATISGVFTDLPLASAIFTVIPVTETTFTTITATVTPTVTVFSYTRTISTTLSGTTTKTEFFTTTSTQMQTSTILTTTTSTVFQTVSVIGQISRGDGGAFLSTIGMFGIAILGIRRLPLGSKQVKHYAMLIACMVLVLALFTQSASGLSTGSIVLHPLGSTTTTTGTATITQTAAPNTVTVTTDSVSTIGQLMTATARVTQTVTVPGTTTITVVSTVLASGVTSIQIITAPPIPGFPLESILVGFAVGLLALLVVRRRTRRGD